MKFVSSCCFFLLNLEMMNDIWYILTLKVINKTPSHWTELECNAELFLKCSLKSRGVSPSEEQVTRLMPTFSVRYFMWVRSQEHWRERVWKGWVVGLLGVPNRLWEVQKLLKCRFDLSWVTDFQVFLYHWPVNTRQITGAF